MGGSSLLGVGSPPATGALSAWRCRPMSVLDEGKTEDDRGVLAVFGAALGLVPPWQVVSVELPRQGRWLPLRAANDEQLAVARRQHHLAAGPARQPLPRFQTGPRPQTRRSLPATHPPIVPEPPPRTATPCRSRKLSQARAGEEGVNQPSRPPHLRQPAGTARTAVAARDDGHRALGLPRSAVGPSTSRPARRAPAPATSGGDRPGAARRTPRELPSPYRQQARLTALRGDPESLDGRGGDA